MKVKGENIICWHGVIQECSWGCSQVRLEMMMVATPCRQNTHCVSIVMLYNASMACLFACLFFFYCLLLVCIGALDRLPQAHIFFTQSKARKATRVTFPSLSFSTTHLASIRLNSAWIISHNNWAQAWRGWGRHIHINTITFQFFQLLSMHF